MAESNPLVEILKQINELSGAALDALLKGPGGGGGEGAPPEGGGGGGPVPAPPEGEAPPQG